MKRERSKKGGWYGERLRHSLARKGVLSRKNYERALQPEEPKIPIRVTDSPEALDEAVTRQDTPIMTPDGQQTVVTTVELQIDPRTGLAREFDEDDNEVHRFIVEIDEETEVISATDGKHSDRKLVPFGGGEIDDERRRYAVVPEDKKKKQR